MDHGAGDRDALLLAAGELVRKIFHLVAQADHLEHLRHKLGDLALRPSGNFECKSDVFVSRFCRQKPEILENYTDMATKCRQFIVAQAY